MIFFKVDTNFCIFIIFFFTQFDIIRNYMYNVYIQYT